MVDTLVLGGLIAGVVLLRDVNDYDCAELSVPVAVRWGDHSWSWDDGRQGWHARVRKECMMVKSAWALAIVNCVLWFMSALLALAIYRRNERVAVKV